MMHVIAEMPLLVRVEVCVVAGSIFQTHTVDVPVCNVF